MAEERVYLAGKIAKEDWRHRLFPDLRSASPQYPVLGRGELTRDGFMYAGPFFVSCDHGCMHGPGQHGMSGTAEVWGLNSHDRYTCLVEESLSRKNIIHHCLGWLANSDVVMAWIDHADAYGTLVELGAARVMRRPIAVFFSSYELREEMWFAAELADYSAVVASAEEAWAMFLLWRHRSKARA